MKSSLTGFSLTWRKGLMCPFCLFVRVNDNFEEHLKNSHPVQWRVHRVIQEWLAHDRSRY